MATVDFESDPSLARPLDVAWIHGSASSKHNTDPEIQVHASDPHTVILRQNMAVDYEAPFLYLLFGRDRVVLIDTGATASAEHFPLRRVVDRLIAERLRAHPRPTYPLLVVHTHAHGDHVAGDAQFADRPDTEVVDAEREAAWAYFGFDQDPDRVALLDLGGRTLECLATPGHDRAAITVFDPHSGFLLTGDTVYRGRLYIEDWAAFGRSIDRLIAFSRKRPVSHVLGCHIEMTRTPGVDYPVLTSFQPDEPPLEMTVAHLHAIRAALDEIGDEPQRRAFADFVLWPV